VKVRISRRTRIAALVAAPGAAIAAVAISFVPFVRPSEPDLPSHADAVVVLSGDHGERLSIAGPLLDSKVAPTLVFDGTSDGGAQDRLCAGAPAPYEVICLRPVPDNTRAEARALANLARSHGWRQLVVVTSTQHVVRSRILFGRCFDGRVTVIGGHPNYGRSEVARQVVHEWVGTVYSLAVARGC